MSKTIFLDVQVPVYFEVRHLLNCIFQVFHFFTTAGGIEQPDGDCEAGRDPRLQRLWRPTHLYRLAQGGGGRYGNGALNVKFQGSRQIHSNAERFSIVEANSSTGLMTSLTIRWKFFLSKSFTLSFPER